jgi:hypothetical protein
MKWRIKIQNGISVNVVIINNRKYRHRRQWQWRIMASQWRKRKASSSENGISWRRGVAWQPRRKPGEMALMAAEMAASMDNESWRRRKKHRDKQLANGSSVSKAK